MSGPLALPLDLQRVCSEFGAPATGTGLTAMVKGGAWVPNNVPGGSIPSAPPIGIQNFVGARHVARFSVDSSAILGAVAMTITSVTPNGDASLVTVILGGTNIVAHGHSAAVGGLFQLTMKVDLVDTIAQLTAELPPGTPQNGAGWYQLYGNTQFRSTVTPVGQFTPSQIANGFNNAPPLYFDTVDPYTGGLEIDQPTIIAPTQTNAPVNVAVDSNGKFSLLFNVSQTLLAGSGSASKNWETRATAQNCYIEFPIRFKVYDSAGLNDTFDAIFHIEIDATTGFTLP